MAKAGARRVTNPAREAQTVGGTDKGRMEEITRGLDAETDGGRVNKRDLVRLAIGNHPRASADELVNIIRRQEVRVGRALVEEVQAEMRGGSGATEMQGGGRPKGEKGKKGASAMSRRTRSDKT